ncbi:hypothetical protein Hte_002265 [Hypoxylon texense]
MSIGLNKIGVSQSARDFERVAEQKVEYIVGKDKCIKASYNDLLSMCTDVVKSPGQEYTRLRAIKKEVNIQKIQLGVRNSVEAEGPDQEFRDVLENVKPYLDKFYSLANFLIGQPAMTEAPEEGERLYVKGLAAATLFQYPIQAFPVDSHCSHTVYLGLSTDDTAVHETHMAIQPRATSQNRVWFRVQSTVDAIVPKETRPSATVQVLEASTHKRKLSSVGLAMGNPWVPIKTHG